MAHILVTGAAGFIGSHLCERLLVRGDSVVGLDNFNDFYDPLIKRRNVEEVARQGDFRLVEGDIRDERLVQDLLGSEPIDVVVHLAAMAGVRPSLSSPLLYEEVNTRGTLVLLQAARAAGVKRFVFGSTSSVYGKSDRVPFREDDPADRPVSPYAATKRAAELLAFNYHHLYGLDVLILRFFTVYGPRQRPEMAIHKFTRLIEQGEPVPMFGDGSSERDYTYVDDIMDGVVKALDRGRGFGIYNLGESKTVALRALIDRIARCLGREVRIERYQDQPGDVPRTCADVSRARRDLGYDPRIDLDEGLRRFVVWYRSTHGGRRPVAERSP
ncbi:MAG: GDP-mannose 4,6-dehydratase [Planctomycetota bacterium]